MGSEKRREAEKNVGLFFTPGDHGGSGIVTPMNATDLGTGEPGPEDEWNFPAEQTPAPAGQTGETAEPARSNEPDRVD